MTSPSASSTGAPYSLRDIRSLYPRISENHLRYLEQWRLLPASPVPRDQREYSFADLQTIKHLASDLDRGTPIRSILRTLLAERQGQLALDFHAGMGGGEAIQAKVVKLETFRPPSERSKASREPLTDPQAALAAKYFAEGSTLDTGDERTVLLAASAYRKALIVDPDLVPAIVNLANIHYSADELIEAQALYERAINLDPDCFEAHFNLGNILHDLGRYETALGCYQDAVALNPTYADAHFYLAVTLEKTGHSAEAKPHWKAYQDLAPDGEWSELAKEFLE